LEVKYARVRVTYGKICEFIYWFSYEIDMQDNNYNGLRSRCYV